MNIENRSLWSFLLSLKGRTRRYHYNMFYLSLFGIYLLAMLVDYLWLGKTAFQKEGTPIVSSIWAVLTIWPSFALHVRRAHDLGYSAWALLAAYVLPYLVILIVGAVSAFSGASPVGMIMALAVMGVIYAVFLFIVEILLCCRKGQVGENRFGADPLAENKVV